LSCDKVLIAIFLLLSDYFEFAALPVPVHEIFVAVHVSVDQLDLLIIRRIFSLFGNDNKNKGGK